MPDSGNSIIKIKFSLSSLYRTCKMFRLKIAFKARCFPHKMIVFLILTPCFLKLVVKRLREVRESSVCNKVVTAFNNLPSVIRAVSPTTSGYALETGSYKKNEGTHQKF